jgi:hypothetical protein
MNELPSLEYSRGVYFERERIIKLLEETSLARNEADLLAFLIALIKGENK